MVTIDPREKSWLLVTFKLPVLAANEAISLPALVRVYEPEPCRFRACPPVMAPVCVTAPVEDNLISPVVTIDPREKSWLLVTFKLPVSAAREPIALDVLVRVYVPPVPSRFTFCPPVIAPV